MERKCILMLAAAMLLFHFCAEAQMKYICEGNGLLVDGHLTPGGMLYTSQEITEHILVTGLATYEFGHGHHTLRALGGIGYANKSNTLAGGIKVGGSTHLSGSVDLSTSFWAYAETGRLAFTTIYIDWHAYLVEFAWRLSSKNAKWQWFAVITNHGANYGVGPKLYNPKSGFYAFVSPTIQWYKMNESHHGSVDAVIVDPVQQPYGLHLTAGIEFGHSDE